MLLKVFQLRKDQVDLPDTITPHTSVMLHDVTKCSHAFGQNRITPAHAKITGAETTRQRRCVCMRFKEISIGVKEQQ